MPFVASDVNPTKHCWQKINVLKFFLVTYVGWKYTLFLWDRFKGYKKNTEWLFQLTVSSLMCDELIEVWVTKSYYPNKKVTETYCSPCLREFLSNLRAVFFCTRFFFIAEVIVPQDIPKHLWSVKIRESSL